MVKKVIQTAEAPPAIGTYSQAVKVGATVYLSGQIPLDPTTSQLIAGDMAAAVAQVFENIRAVCNAAGGTLENIAKMTIYLTDLAQANVVNDVMQEYFQQPFPARAMVEVSALPKGAPVEVDAIMVTD